MSLLAGGLTGLFRPRHEYLPGTDLFLQIDVSKLAERLKLEERGEADGQAGFAPGLAPGAANSVELLVRREINDVWQNAVQMGRRAEAALRGR